MNYSEIDSRNEKKHPKDDKKNVKKWVPQTLVGIQSSRFISEIAASTFILNSLRKTTSFNIKNERKSGKMSNKGWKIVESESIEKLSKLSVIALPHKIQYETSAHSNLK